MGLKLKVSILTIFSAISMQALAYRVIPVVNEIAPSGAASKKTIEVDNDAGVPVAIEIKVYKRIMHEDGTESMEDDVSDLFTLHPQQFMVPANKTRAIQVKYIGDKNLASEAAYRLHFGEVPVDFTKPSEGRSGGVKFALNYDTALYVTKPEFKDKIVMQDLQIITKDNKKMLQITLENQGNKHGILYNPKITIGNVELNSDDLKDIKGQNILAGIKRVVAMDLPEKVQSVSGALFSY